MKEKTPCEEMGYKVGDEFIVQEDACGFVKGQVIKLYRDDGSGCPLFQGINSWYNLCDGQEGAYFDLDCVVKLVKEEKEEMQFDMKGFDLKTNPWFIRVNNEQEYNAARDWVKSRGLDFKYSGDYFKGLAAISNHLYSDGRIDDYIYRCDVEDDLSEYQEIKVTFKTVVDSVTLPEVKTEQQKQIEELEKTILLAQQQIEELKGIK